MKVLSQKTLVHHPFGFTVHSAKLGSLFFSVEISVVLEAFLVCLLT